MCKDKLFGEEGVSRATAHSSQQHATSRDASLCIIMAYLRHHSNIPTVDWVVCEKDLFYTIGIPVHDNNPTRRSFLSCEIG